ncbi:hypothetical protein PO124_12225 [Bacillus licheniformis]|nr:hypothetical protein [Bacillus licheniformis]
MGLMVIVNLIAISCCQSGICRLERLCETAQSGQRPGLL